MFSQGPGVLKQAGCAALLLLGAHHRPSLCSVLGMVTLMAISLWRLDEAACMRRCVSVDGAGGGFG